MSEHQAIKWLEDGFQETVELTQRQARMFGEPLMPLQDSTRYMKLFKPVAHVDHNSALRPFASLKDG